MAVAVAAVKRAGREPILLQRAVNGYLINRLQHSILHEAYHLIEDGIATAGDDRQGRQAAARSAHVHHGPARAEGYRRSRDARAGAAVDRADALAHQRSDRRCCRTWSRAATIGIRSGKGFYDMGGHRRCPRAAGGQSSGCSGCSPSSNAPGSRLGLARMSRRGRSGQGPDQLRRPGVRQLSAALVRQVDGLFERDAPASDRRHRHVRQRLQQLPSPDARTGRGGEARRARRGRSAARLPDDLARRGVPQSDEPGLPQSDVDGRRGDDPRAADERGRTGRRLRQDGARAADGRDVRRRARHPARGRSDDDRPVPGRAAGRVHRLPALLGALPRRRREPRRRDLRGRGQPRRHEPARAPSWAPPARWRAWPRRSGWPCRTAAAIPAVHADRLRIAEATGAEAVRLAPAGTTPAAIVTREAIENAARVLLAIGGSTNGVIHLAAIAGRVGLTLDLRALNALSDTTPVLVNLKPTGQHYMEDFHAAGGVGAVLQELEPLLHLDCVAGHRRNARGRSPKRRRAYVDRAIIRPLTEPFHRHGGLVGLFGNLAPNGSVLKTRRRGRAAVRTHRPRRGVHGPRRSARPASTTRRSMSRQTMCWCCRTRVRSARECPRPGICRFRPSWRGRREGHGAHLGRTDERHRVRHRRASHLARSRRSGGPSGLVRNGDRIRLSVKERKLDVLLSERSSPSGAARGAPGDSRPGLREALRRVRPRRGVGLRLRFPARWRVR